jgi:hypothetical protein
MGNFDLICQAMRDHYGDKFIRVRAVSSVNDSGDTEVNYDSRFRQSGNIRILCLNVTMTTECSALS